MLDRIALNVGSLSLLPCDAAAPAVTFAAGEYDLVQGDALEAMGRLELCGLRLELIPANADGRELPMGVAMYLHGLRSDGSEFDVVSSSPRTLQLSAEQGHAFGTQPLLLGFDLGHWFSGVDVHGVHTGADGVVHLDATLNPAPLTAFETQTSVAVGLYVDANGNGRLDAEERTPIASPKLRERRLAPPCLHARGLTQPDLSPETPRAYYPSA